MNVFTLCMCFDGYKKYILHILFQGFFPLFGGSWTGSWQVWWDSAQPNWISLFLGSFLFPKPLVILRFIRLWPLREQRSCMTAVWVESSVCSARRPRRYSNAFPDVLLSRVPVVRRPGLTLTGSTHLVSFEKSQWTINFPIFFDQWSLMNLIIMAYFHICWWKI